MSVAPHTLSTEYKTDDVLQNYEPDTLEDRIYDLLEREEELPEDESLPYEGEVARTLDEFLYAADQGDVSAVEKIGGEFEVNEWFKPAILLNFRTRPIQTFGTGAVQYNDVMPPRDVSDFPEKRSRNTPSTYIRAGSYIGEDAIIMGPSIVNVGAHVGDDVMVDSLDVVGSTAYIGDEVKLGAMNMIGGVLEPKEATPVILDDGASTGAGTIVTSGFYVGEDTAVGERTLLSPNLEIHDFTEEEVRQDGQVGDNKRVFNRWVESESSDDYFKPVIAVLEKGEDTDAQLQREDSLRDN